MSEVYHIPAMLKQTIEGLAIKFDGLYADVTFGGGGHSRAILEAGAGHLYSFDQDQDALSNAIEDERWTFVHSNFRYLRNWMDYYGVEGIEIIQTYFGDKGYWENELFTESGLAEAVVKGLEQSMDTIPPKISLVKRFGPYSNDILPEYAAKSSCYIALPRDFPKIGEIEKGKSNIIAIGPERGWTKYEAAQFIKAGFQPVSLGNRVVRTEAAVHACVAHFI